MSEALRMSPALTGKDGINLSEGEVFSYPVHSHSYYELIFYSPFEGEIKINTVTILPTSPLIVLMTPVDLHTVTCTGKSSRFVKIAFTEDALGGFLSKQLIEAHLLQASEEHHPIETLLEKLKQALSREEQIILLRAIVLILLKDGSKILSPERAPSHAIVAAAIAVILDEFTEELTLKSVAKRLNVSHQHLSACFPKRTGLSFSAYLCDIRLRHARSLLQNTNDTVTEICYACGYRNLSHFLRSFKRKYGETPKEYRNKSI